MDDIFPYFTRIYLLIGNCRTKMWSAGHSSGWKQHMHAAYHKCTVELQINVPEGKIDAISFPDKTGKNVNPINRKSKAQQSQMVTFRQKTSKS